MMKKPIASIFMSLTAMTLLLGGSYAYFTDTQYSTANMFTGGTLDLWLAGGSGDGYGNVVGTWVSPTNWAPGQSFTSTLSCTNLGNVGATHIYFYPQNLNDASSFMDQIIITDLHERFNAVTTGNQAVTLESQLSGLGGADGNGVLTLGEFARFAAGYYTIDDQTGDGIVVGGGNLWDYDLVITFQFSETSTLQGATCSFDMKLVATQNSPTDGMACLHSI